MDLATLRRHNAPAPLTVKARMKWDGQRAAAEAHP
jgi:hypothetical protein